MGCHRHPLSSSHFHPHSGHSTHWELAAIYLKVAATHSKAPATPAEVFATLWTLWAATAREILCTVRNTKLNFTFLFSLSLVVEIVFSLSLVGTALLKVWFLYRKVVLKYLKYGQDNILFENLITAVMMMMMVLVVKSDRRNWTHTVRTVLVWYHLPSRCPFDSLG